MNLPFGRSESIIKTIWKVIDKYYHPINILETSPYQIKTEVNAVKRCPRMSELSFTKIV